MDPGDLHHEHERIIREEGATGQEAVVLYHLESLYDAWQEMLEAKYPTDGDSPTPDNEATKTAAQRSFQAQYTPLINSVFADIHRREHPSPGEEFEEGAAATRRSRKLDDPEYDLQRLNTQISKLEKVTEGELHPDKDPRISSLLEDHESEQAALLNLKAQRDDVRTRLDQRAD